MPPPAIIDPVTLDFTNLLADRAQIQQVNPHRHEFALLDGVITADMEQRTFAGYYDVRADDWWTRGHIPGRPLFPGVLMIEVAAQLSSYMTRVFIGTERFVGLGGVEDTKFRDTVEPPCRLVVVGRALEVRPRRTKCATQGFIDDVMVFEAMITGMML